MPDAAEVHRVDDVHQGRQAQVTANHAQHFTVLFHRHGDGHYQPADRGHVRRREHGCVGGDRLLVPRALTRIIAFRHLGVRALGKHTVYLTDIRELEIGREGRLIDQPRKIGVGTLVRDVLGQVFQHQDPATQPVLHTAGRQRARLLDRGVEVLLDGVSLQIVVVQSEQGKRQYHYARSGQKDFMAEFEIHVRGTSYAMSGDAFRVQRSM
ncbi:hypothetical protein D3C80_1180420 [compost metagenome]